MIKTEGAKTYLFDTSAIIALWANEKGADEVEAILRSGVKVYVSFMSYMEGRYKIWKRAGRAMAEEFTKYLELLPIKRIDVTNRILTLASEIKATNNLSVADSWIIASAMENNAILLHKDPEFEQVKERVNLHALPYKNKK